MGYTLKNLARNKTRTVLLAVALTLAFALTTTMFAFSEGMVYGVREIVEESGVDLFVYAKGGEVAFYQPDFTDSRALASELHEHHAVRAAWPMLVENLYLAAPDAEEFKIIPVAVCGVVPKLVGAVGGLKLREGALFLEKDDPFYANGTYSGEFTAEILINSIVAKTFKIGVNTTLLVNNFLPGSVHQTHQWNLSSTEFRVVGVVDAVWQEPIPACFVHLAELQWLVNKTEDVADSILVDLYDPRDSDNVKAWIEDNFDFSVATQDDFIARIREFTDIWRGFAMIIALTTLLIAFLFFATLAVVSVRERLPELAVLRALGFSWKSIYGWIFAECLVLCILALVLGTFAGVACANLLDAHLQKANMHAPAGFHFTRLTPSVLASVTCANLAMCLLASLFAGRQVLRMNVLRILTAE